VCGIAGIVSASSADPVEPAVVARMCAAILHRGPDDHGIHTGPGVGLGMRRLSIIDRSGGHQPIYSEDGGVAVVYNGEIYNYAELRRQLQERGHRFSTRSDTEVIVHLYEEMGRRCVTRLRGMFALALWDERRRSLLLARDRVGKKPLFYARLGPRLIFGSEIKALLQVPELPIRVSPAAIDAYLRFTFVPAPLTIFEDIYKLLPGHTLEYRDGDISTEAYWDLRFPAERSRRSEAEWQNELLEQLREAVRIRLMSEVPLGAFLSGGVDSSAVVALMAEASGQPVKTFSIGFKDRSFDETHYARVVARRCETEHREQIVEPEGLDTLLPELAWHFDEPFGDSSALPTYYVSKMAKQSVTVVLTGDGGDEAFAGYSTWRGEKLSQLYGRMPRPLRRLATPELVRSLRRLTLGRHSRTLDRAERVLAAARQSPSERFLSKSTRIPEQLRRAIYSDAFSDVALARPVDVLGPWRDVAEEDDPVDRLTYWQTRFYLPNDMLVKVDRMTMAHSLEARCPFLDHVLLEFAARIPPHLRFHGWTTKYVLKRALGVLLPREVLWRRKQGFGVPIRAWFRDDLAEWARDILLSPRCLQRGYFNGRALSALIQDHVTGRADHGERLWVLLNLEIWHRVFVDNEAGRLPTRRG
jgi:asparagine synthase (glutamine-hydrolysing)